MNRFAQLRIPIFWLVRDAVCGLACILNFVFMNLLQHLRTCQREMGIFILRGVYSGARDGAIQLDREYPRVSAP